jgi:hypothetical protein
MDPDTTLREILRVSREVIDKGNYLEVEMLAERVLELDKWLADGGFLPFRWERACLSGESL